MEEIASLRRDDNDKMSTRSASQSSRPKAEAWIVAAGDCVKIQISKNQSQVEKYSLNDL